MAFALYQWYRYHRLSTTGTTTGLSLWQGVSVFVGVHLLSCLAYGAFVAGSVGASQQISAPLVAFATWIKSLSFSILPLTLLLVTSATGFRLLTLL